MLTCSAQQEAPLTLCSLYGPRWIEVQGVATTGLLFLISRSETFSFYTVIILNVTIFFKRSLKF
jgi:hypothetical protein